MEKNDGHAQPEQAAVWTQHARIVEQLQERFPDTAAMLAEAGPEVLASPASPRSTGYLAAGDALGSPRP